MKTTKKPLCTAILTVLSTRIVQAAESEAQAQKIHQLFEDNCAGCHGSDHGSYIAPALNSETLR